MTDQIDNDPPLLSLVVPMYNEQDMIQLFLDRTVPVVEQISDRYEIICINDGSKDGTLAVLNSAHKIDPRVKIIDLSRNFGKEAALTAGIDFAAGQAVIPIDVDLQDPPEVIPKLVEKWREGYDVVLAVRGDRTSDSLVKRTTSSMFYHVANWMNEVPIPPNAGDYRLMDRSVVDALKHLPERARFMKGLFAWLGFKQTSVTYTRPARAHGKSKHNYWGLWNFAIEGIISFSTLPLRIWTYFGLGVALISLTYMVYIFGRTLLTGVDVPGYASLIVILLFFSGLNMIGLGILGEYVGRVFSEVKGRPIYLVQKTVGVDTGDSDSSKVAEKKSRHVADKTGSSA